MKLQVEVDGEAYTLDLYRNGANVEFKLGGVGEISGSASVVEVMPGLFSVLFKSRSFTTYVSRTGEQLEIVTSGRKHVISIADPRDRRAGKQITAGGPMEIRAQMPGKVIKLLVAPGDPVETGQGVIIVEAMKMQNEMKSPKNGVVSRIQAQEGATVGMGESLMTIE